MSGAARASVARTRADLARPCPRGQADLRTSAARRLPDRGAAGDRADRRNHRDVARAGERQCRRRSEEHTSELQSLMRISYAVFCLKKKKQIPATTNTHMNSNQNTAVK